MKRPLIIEDEFDSFVRKVYPGLDNTCVQIRESRRIWYAAMCRILTHMLTVSNTFSEDSATEEINNLFQQLDEFFELIKKDSD